MRPSTIIGLAAATILMVVAAAFGVAQHYRFAVSPLAEERLFPGLEDGLSDVARIEVEHATGKLTMTRTEAGWVVAEKHAYAANAEMVGKVALQLSQLRLVEPMTRMAERFPRVWLDDPSNQGSRAKLVRLKDTGGATLAEVMVGRPRYNLGGGGLDGIYIRRPGEDQVWLAQGSLEFGKTEREWLQRQITDVASKRVHKVSAIDADGTAFVAVKAKPSDEHFEIQNLPEDAKLRRNWYWDVDDTARALRGLEFDDVVPHTDKQIAGSEVLLTAEVRTYDGLIVTLTMLEDAEAEQSWTRITASVDPAPVGVPDGEDTEGFKTADEVKREADAINAAVADWTYGIADWRLKSLKLRLVDVLAKPQDDTGS
ncbi:MAG: DUF4340 domain-containing protein [Rhodospirillales bacterium]|jgi:hypothetical protein|nr:DUF4340 domain-containing protein [Rhodospirillales bacterium]MDP6805531.1 DUF4340 domain-containing protein [Rhodospirillales bacterium]